MNGPFWTAFQQVFLDPWTWAIILASATYGILVGSVPGLTATMAVALVVPITYWLDPLPALTAIVTLVNCAIFAGDIPSILVRMPGTPASAAYVDVGYRMARRGQAAYALGICLVSSIFGGFLGVFVLIVMGRWLAGLATWFSVAEYFWLYLLGLSCAAVIAEGRRSRALFSLLIGLLLSTVGLSAAHAQARFTFGVTELYQGLNFIPVMIGLFGMSEVLKNLVALDSRAPEVVEPTAQTSGAHGWLWQILVPPTQLVARRWRSGLIAGAIGTAIGILPGAGADIAAWVSLAVSRRLRGWTPAQGEAEPDVDGLCDSTGANNAALAGAWIPALVFGIPGDSITAIVIGVLLMKNIKPGPDIFTKQAELAYGLYLVFLLSNAILLPVGLAAIRLGSQVVRVPRRILLVAILQFCVVGSFAINGSAFDVGVMLVAGLVGFALERVKVPVGPIVLGMILGGPLEERCLQTLAAGNGSLLAFVDRPVSAFLAAGFLGLWGLAIVSTLRGRRIVGAPADL